MKKRKWRSPVWGIGGVDDDDDDDDDDEDGEDDCGSN